jgi:hypothetical protein
MSNIKRCLVKDCEYGDGTCCQYCDIELDDTGKCTNYRKANPVPKCKRCRYYEENGIGLSSVPECMKHEEYACEAVKYCNYTIEE